MFFVVRNFDTIWTGIYPTISTGGRAIILSTPNGVGNWFHQTYVDADTGAIDFNPTKIMWDAHPDRDQEWFENETKNMCRREIAQELECNFNMSGETVIHPEDIEKMERLGIYEVAPEDFALIDYASSSKIEAQTIVRKGGAQESKAFKKKRRKREEENFMQ